MAPRHYTQYNLSLYPAFYRAPVGSLKGLRTWRPTFWPGKTDFGDWGVPFGNQRKVDPLLKVPWETESAGHGLANWGKRGPRQRSRPKMFMPRPWCTPSDNGTPECSAGCCTREPWIQTWFAPEPYWHRWRQPPRWMTKGKTCWTFCSVMKSCLKHCWQVSSHNTSNTFSINFQSCSWLYNKNQALVCTTYSLTHFSIEDWFLSQRGQADFWHLSTLFFRPKILSNSKDSRHTHTV